MSKKAKTGENPIGPSLLPLCARMLTRGKAALHECTRTCGMW